MLRRPENPAGKPFSGFLIHRITTHDRIKKHDLASDKPEVEMGKTERVINLFAV